MEKHKPAFTLFFLPGVTDELTTRVYDSSDTLDTASRNTRFQELFESGPHSPDVNQKSCPFILAAPEKEGLRLGRCVKDGFDKPAFLSGKRTNNERSAL